MKWLDELKKLDPCCEAVEYAETHKTLSSAWKSCERGDWMLWYAGKICTTESARKRLVLAACECARQSLQYVTAGETRPLIAIETAEKWARGESGVTIEDVQSAAAASAAYASAYAAYAAASAAYAAYAVASAAYAAYAATSAASAAYSTAYASAAAHAAYAAALKDSADIVRKHYPKPPRKAVTK